MMPKIITWNGKTPGQAYSLFSNKIPRVTFYKKADGCCCLATPTPFLSSPFSFLSVQDPEPDLDGARHTFVVLHRHPGTLFFVKIDSCVDVLLPVKWPTSRTNWKRTDQYVSSGG